VRKRSFRPTLKLTLQHSKSVGAAPLSHPVGEGLGVRAKNASASHAVNPSGVLL